MSDFHLQQLAAASASVPGNIHVPENSNVETNILNSQQQPAGNAAMVPDAVPANAGASTANTTAPSYSVFRFHSLPAPSIETCHSNVSVSVNEVTHGNGNANGNATTTTTANASTGASSTSASANSHPVDLTTHMTMPPQGPHAEAVHVHYHVHPPPQFQTQAMYHHHQQQQQQQQYQQQQQQQQYQPQQQQQHQQYQPQPQQQQQQQQHQQQNQQQQPFGHHLQTQQHGNVHRNDNGTVVENNIPSIPPPHPVHAPHATTVDHSQMGMASFPLMQPETLTDPIHHHNQLTQPVTVTTNEAHKPDSNSVTILVTDTTTAKGTNHQVPLAGDAVDLAKADDVYAKYKAKCDECDSLILALSIKTSRIRKLEKDLSNLKAQTNMSNNMSNNSNKTSTNGQKDAATSSHDQGNSGGNPSLGFQQGNNNNMTMNNSSITIDVDIGPSSSRTRSYDQRWKARFQDLVKYKLTHGDCIVPKSYKDKGLHSWVRKQRILKKDFDLGLASEESMTQERVNALQSVGFAWVVGHQSNDGQWEANFQQLVVFKSQFGHTRVPQTYDKTLHKWVLNQRCRRRLLEDKGEGKAKGMTWARIEKLDAIDFSWAGKK